MQYEQMFLVLAAELFAGVHETSGAPLLSTAQIAKVAGVLERPTAIHEPFPSNVCLAGDAAFYIVPPISHLTNSRVADHS